MPSTGSKRQQVNAPHPESSAQHGRRIGSASGSSLLENRNKREKQITHVEKMIQWFHLSWTSQECNLTAGERVRIREYVNKNANAIMKRRRCNFMGGRCDDSR